MITASDFRNGVTIEKDGNVYEIIEFQHVKPGKGAAFVRTKLKDIINDGVGLVSTPGGGITQAAGELERINARIDELEALDYTKTKDLKIASPTAFYNAIMLAFGKRFDGYLSLSAEEVERLELARKEARKAARKKERDRKKAAGKAAKVQEVATEQNVMDVINARMNG